MIAQAEPDNPIPKCSVCGEDILVLQCSERKVCAGNWDHYPVKSDGCQTVPAFQIIQHRRTQAAREYDPAGWKAWERAHAQCMEVQEETDEEGKRIICATWHPERAALPAKKSAKQHARAVDQTRTSLALHAILEELSLLQRYARYASTMVNGKLLPVTLDAWQDRIRRT